MKYLLNLSFNKTSKEYLEKIQKELSRKYRINKFLPSLYIHLQTIETNNQDKLFQEIEEFFNPYKYFKAYLDAIAVFENPNKIISALIIDKGYLSRIERQIGDNLLQKGFNVSEPVNRWGLNILLCSNVNLDKKVNFKEYEANFKTCKKDYVNKYLTIESAELLKYNSGKRDNLVKRFKFKEY